MTPKKKDDLAEKVREAVRAHGAGVRGYARHDALVEEIAKEIEPGQVVKTGKKSGYKLVDEFADKEILWKPCGFRRWKLEKV